MNKDAELLAEAYTKVIEGIMHCKSAKEGCDCDKCEECESNQTVDEAKKAKPDFLDVDKDGDKKESMKKALKDKKKSVHKENAEMANAYQTILEYKLINKKFARRYNKLTSAMLKAQPGTEEYGNIKTEREDLVSILRDHGMSPKDLEEYLVKKEKENPLPEVQDFQSMNQYKDSSYSDTADIPSADNEYGSDMSAPQAEVAQMPADAPVPQEVQAVQAQ